MPKVPKVRTSNVLRDRAEQASCDIVSLLDQAKTKALRVDLVGATEDLRKARQKIVQTCLQYESKMLEMEESLTRSRASASLAERQLQSMSYFIKKNGEPAAAAPIVPVESASA